MRFTSIAATGALAALLALLPGLLPGRGGALPGARAGVVPGTGPRIRVTGSSPGNGAAAVFTDPVAVRFNRPVDFDSVTPDTVLVRRGSLPVPGSFMPAMGRKGEPDTRILVWTPGGPLLPGASYSMRVTLEVRSAEGRALDNVFESSFTTDPGKSISGITPLPAKVKFARAPGVGPPPKVRWTDPLAGFGSVFSDRIRIRFNKAMDGNSLHPASVRILTGNSDVPGVLTFPSEGDPREVGFVPESPLFPSTTYTMVVTRDARTSKGANLREEYRAGFSTSPFKEGVRPVQPGDFTPGPLLIVGRAFHTASPLDNGDVVVAGGEGVPGVPTAVCEIYRRSSDMFQRTGDLSTARRKHAAVTLKSGKVLACGGFGPAGQTLTTVELWDPVTETWGPAASMAASRAHHTATLLKDGRVLVAGGFTTDGGSFDYEGTAEVYQPTTDTWIPAGPLAWPRGGHTATLLADGKVLLAGGARSQQNIAELYEPVPNACRETAGKPAEHRIFHAAAVVRLGSVLLAGGGPPGAERYEPETETFQPSGSSPPIGLPVSESPWYSTLTALPGGRAAFIGGLSLGGGQGGGDLVLAQIQLWDSRGGSGAGAFFPMLFYLDVPRAAHTITPLGDGRFLIVGGLGTTTSLNERATTHFFPSN